MLIGSGWLNAGRAAWRIKLCIPSWARGATRNVGGYRICGWWPISSACRRGFVMIVVANDDIRLHGQLRRCHSERPLFEAGRSDR